ncbi:hypothetical protein [Aquabacterium sp.]|uniref:hypothetical protein n=1 Tax=Aquabacterium sp. TaxID=1872578 RepID=UPI002C29EA05|nr:hypothetical protein [Aquabacterium sp.]HSW06409.1 hypothetical protein [Aquabacterium sp.]
MTPIARLLGACWALGMAAAAGAQVHEAQPNDTETARTIESCVSTDRLVFARADPWVALDAQERASAFEQIIRRHPVLARDGVLPSHIVLWRRQGGVWLYVTLLAHPTKPSQACFTATVVAQGLDITTALLQKYFALRSALGALADDRRVSGLRRPAARS